MAFQTFIFRHTHIFFSERLKNTKKKPAAHLSLASPCWYPRCECQHPRVCSNTSGLWSPCRSSWQRTLRRKPTCSWTLQHCFLPYLRTSTCSPVGKSSRSSISFRRNACWVNILGVPGGYHHFQKQLSCITKCKRCFLVPTTSLRRSMPFPQVRSTGEPCWGMVSNATPWSPAWLSRAKDICVCVCVNTISMWKKSVQYIQYLFMYIYICTYIYNLYYINTFYIMIYHYIINIRQYIQPGLEAQKQGRNEPNSRHMASKRPPFHLLPALIAADPSKRLSRPDLYIKHRGVTVSPSSILGGSWWFPFRLLGYKNKKTWIGSV